jgi:hypothetical protein
MNLRRIEEQWMTPRGGTMLGIGRTVARDSTVESEYMQLREQEGHLVFTAKSSGQEEASFRSIELTDSMVVFENPADRVRWSGEMVRADVLLDPPRARRSRSGNPFAGLQHQRHMNASMAEHLHKSVDTEAVDLPAGEVADPGLGDSHQAGGLGLGEAPLLDQSGQMDHQVRAKAEILGLLRLKAEIHEYIA